MWLKADGDTGGSWCCSLTVDDDEILNMYISMNHYGWKLQSDRSKLQKNVVVMKTAHAFLSNSCFTIMK